MAERDGHIRVLPLHVANKIAAGEVVERPASVLKELLENAIDAGASRIEVAVNSGGRKLVSVRDNGCGMSRDDALLSLERQATSKIRDVDDIEHIDTLGFRGEAIPSIASVSRFTLVTRLQDAEAGTKLIVNAGSLDSIEECGAPPGTCVEVRDLFCNVPARRKFLRAIVTEESVIRTTFTVHALAHPNVGFTLKLDEREVYRLPSNSTLVDRIRDLFGIPFSESLMPIQSPPLLQRLNVGISGFVEQLGSNSTFRREQYIFVNGRPATASTINYALREVYPRVRDEARSSLVLFIEVPPEQVDVNVHPAKREVRFRRPGDVREAIIASITETLASATSFKDTNKDTQSQPTFISASPEQQTDSIELSQNLKVTPNEVSPVVDLPLESTIKSVEVGDNKTSELTDFSLKSDSAQVVPFSTPLQRTLPLSYAGTHSSERVETSKTTIQTDEPQTEQYTKNKLWCWFRFLAQTSTGFILLETDSGLVTLDPCAARERIAYEKITNQKNKKIEIQELLIPATVSLPPVESARIRTYKTDLEKVGFALDELAGDVWKIDAVPNFLSSLPLADVLISIASDIAELGAKRGAKRLRDELIASSVAHTYARQLVKLTAESATQLVNELASTNMPYVCPRGRPVMVFSSNRDISRKFGKL